MSQELIQEIDNLRAEIQQLKDENESLSLYGLATLEKLSILKGQVEAAKTKEKTFKQWLQTELDALLQYDNDEEPPINTDLAFTKVQKKFLEVFGESAQNSGETTP